MDARFLLLFALIEQILQGASRPRSQYRPRIENPTATSVTVGFFLTIYSAFPAALLSARRSWYPTTATRVPLMIPPNE